MRSSFFRLINGHVIKVPFLFAAVADELPPVGRQHAAAAFVFAEERGVIGPVFALQ